MARILVSWIGRSDLIAAAKNEPDEDLGPILRLLRKERFDEVHLLNDFQPGANRRDEASVPDYRDWLATNADLDGDVIQLHTIGQNLRNRYDLAFHYTREELLKIRDQQRETPARFALLLSPGYPAALVGLIVAHQTLLDPDTELFETSREKGVERVTLPFFLSVDAVPILQRRWQLKLEQAGDEDAETAASAFDAIIGSSKAMRLAKQTAARLAIRKDASVILRGETGSGKEEFARAIHAASPRRGKPFLAINCAAIPGELLESELFGYKSGAFTDAKEDRPGKVAAADGGTLFLDEIGDMSFALQAKLLRFLQERKYCRVGSIVEESADVRVLAATHQDLERAIEAGRFRADLYYRLNVVSLNLPPLRDRGRDVQELAHHFLAGWNKAAGEAKSLSDGALALLGRYPWRGNVRELKNAVERLAMLAVGNTITPEDVDLWLGPPATPTGMPLSQLAPPSFACHLVAIVDELLARFRLDEQLPWPLPPQADLFEHVLEPLVLGRALQAAQGDRTRAGLMFRGSRVDLSEGKPDRRRVERYEKDLKPSIAEETVAQLRGVLS